MIIYNKHSKNGFSLAEILIYTGILAIVGTLFSGILITVTKVQNRQTASNEVNSQLNFILQTIQRLVRDSSLIEITAGSPAASLKLRMQDPIKDPTIISLSGKKALIQEGSSDPTSLTTDSVNVDLLQFIKFSNYPGHDTVQVDLTISYNTQNLERNFSKSLTSAIARVSAATFDSDIIPGSDNSYNVGLSSSRWQNLNLSGNLTAGEAKINGIAGDGTGKVACIKADGYLGTCATQPNGSGVCTCN